MTGYTGGGSGGCQSDLTVTDAYGDSCTWYDSNVDSCGDYDSGSFIASELCCACGGGLTGGNCVDQDYGVADVYGDKCEWYESSPDSCGTYDDDDFVADELCCACGGGGSGSSSTSTGDCVDDLSVTDAYGDSCAWYADN